MPAARRATLPFELTSDHQVIAAGAVTQTEKRRHGVLRLGRALMVVQWRVEREISRVGSEIRTDVERDGMREVAVPVEMLGDARVRYRGRWWRRGELVITARDLLAFDPLAGDDGFTFDHPAELVLPIRATDDALAHEFASEVELAIAELALAAAERVADAALPIQRPREAMLPRGGSSSSPTAPFTSP